jgi:SagB-type dehydrogenase family enzyme
MEMEENTLRIKEHVLQHREVMKAEFNHFESSFTDQLVGIEVPTAQKHVENGAEVINLPEVDSGVISETDIYSCLSNRKSRRKYNDEPITINELSFLLWATQGVKRKSPDNRYSTRTVPSGGSRQPFETYLAVHDVKGLKPGIYRYQPFEHQLVFLFEVDDLKEKVSKAAHDQKFAGNCAVTFIWSAVPYRTEWRYTLASAKIILQDSGHLCQNLYLACEAISCGTCAIGAYDQQLFDGLLKLDGTDEFTVYVAPVGKVDKPAPVVKISPEELQKYCGTYLCESKDLKRTIRVKDGILLYCRGNGMDSVLECTGLNRFVMADGNAVLTFSPDLKERSFLFQSEEGESIEFRTVEK